jgi:hypothetical protein
MRLQEARSYYERVGKNRRQERAGKEPHRRKDIARPVPRPIEGTCPSAVNRAAGQVGSAASTRLVQLLEDVKRWEGKYGGIGVAWVNRRIADDNGHLSHAESREFWAYF